MLLRDWKGWLPGVADSESEEKNSERYVKEYLNFFKFSDRVKCGNIKNVLKQEI